ncbi:TetR/AcrR family transcriptional regulator [Acinetobacter bereziniae]|uniref:TetR/AcrR family transcriptional regulator n=1 Tax=Acinetobacter bereziniae TaxID=106648 RepID=UPI0012501A06|nr:TetR/AcrR family transcriptional regulator [Acinetobacter bereziniae]MBI0396404.1 TetR/AcrR family transcriptional regulator [Acinetobacter bereziniae]MBJ8450494.1 TetR/AcrR family transcriptional regulator [Acinetobacter bereziniae]MBJ8455564.1 TetR/AcrR family transcriptional regulator [Acinetobacter bereziniae]MBO3652815.1 TetR/AcrR family transcriptional regulator [Acinetobacter bereziniae]MCM8512503.1 TetR/AcrR family transcriptional regulator [Acinetobacter bereziniae]
MTAIKIQKAALERFAKQGFSATSMNEIAMDVGIKKPSIYAHFKNKDDLYLSLIPIMVERELNYAKQILIGGEEVFQQFNLYLRSIDQRFDQSFDVQFWVNALLNPPKHIYAEVIEPMHLFMEHLEQIFMQALKDLPENQLDHVTLARMYMSFVDALQSELIYGGKQKYQLRLTAILNVLDVLKNTCK